jgi:hypothetical protein
MSRKRIDYASPLLKLTRGRDPRKGGRPKALRGGIDPNKLRTKGNLLRDIAIICSTDLQFSSRKKLAMRLREWFPEYRKFPDWMVRRDVRNEIAQQIEYLKSIRPERWPEVFDIQPPAEMTEQALFEKALEALREALKRHIEALHQPLMQLDNN